MIIIVVLMCSVCTDLFLIVTMIMSLHQVKMLCWMIDFCASLWGQEKASKLIDKSTLVKIIVDQIV